jgi:AmmeMemoRadiSam system protein B/AmmeMemoRadiSam system protein A
MEADFRSRGVRAPAVAGLFYPDDPASLAREVEGFLDGPKEPVLRPGLPKAILVPHAGYAYSGPIAGSAHALLRPARGIVRRVVVLGPCHRVAVRGLALPEVAAFDTPLGRVPIDLEAVARLADLPQVIVHRETHAREHSIEVQLPFLQVVLGDFTLVPLVVGEASAAEVAEVMDRLWGGAETLFVISSDLSHYLGYEEARSVDRATVDAMLAGRTDIDHHAACGATPVVGLLEAARSRGLVPELLDLRNSGDTAGDRDRVVGYAAIAFWQPGQAAYDETHGGSLVSIARGAISSALGAGLAAIPDVPWLAEHRASFVTLTMDGDLRGCIGSLEAWRPLGEDVASNARGAALRDPRFPPVRLDELASIRIDVSLLSSPSPLVFADHADLVAQLRPGLDGLLLVSGGRRGTFLPQVWESLPDPEEFLARLKEKAGLSASTPSPHCRVWRYRVWKWREPEPQTDPRGEGEATTPAVHVT